MRAKRRVSESNGELAVSAPAGRKATINTATTQIDPREVSNMPTLYPLTFKPLFKQYLWGGRRLGSLLGKPIGSDDDYAESWEVVDHGEDQSVVANGALRGVTLGQLVREHGPELFGSERVPTDQQGEPQFPLLLKFLDANRTLSVQVHPNDAQGAKLSPPDLGKTEAWLVLATEPGSKIYAGLKEGIDRDALASATEAGECDQCLHVIEPSVGDCAFIPAGTVHALGEGLVIAEIQQASNTTFRLFDWNRVGKDGQPRPLHITQSLDVTDYQRGPVVPHVPAQIADGIERLVDCDKFVLDRRKVTGEQRIDSTGRFRLLSTLAGEATLTVDGKQIPLPLGQTVLLPAVCEGAAISAPEEAILMDVSPPRT